MGKIIPQEIKDAVIRRYQDEEISILDLAIQHGVSHNAVHQWLRLAGVKVRERGVRVGCKREYRRERKAMHRDQLAEWPAHMHIG